MSRKRNNHNNYGYGDSPEVFDPTKNVLQLVEAAVKRLDDLRDAEARRINEQMALRAEYDAKLASAESARLDAIRVVDVNAVAVATERTNLAATVLAKQVSDSAEALRSMVATTASTIATQLADLTTRLTDRIGLLEASKYESKGRAGLSTPILMVLAAIGGGFVGFLLQHLFKIVNTGSLVIR